MESTSESLLSWRQELITLLHSPPRERPGPKQVTWADLTETRPIEPEPVSGRPKSCLKAAKTNFDYKREPHCSLRSPSRPFPSAWRDTVRSRVKTPAAPERPALSRLRDVPTGAPRAILSAFLRLTENTWEELAETGTFLVDPSEGPEPGRVAWPDTPMIQRHYTPTVERNLQEILQQTLREADQLRETALIKPGRSRFRRCGTWLKEKVLGRPTPKKSCLKQRVSEDRAGPSRRATEVRYFTSRRREIPARAELHTDIRVIHRA